MKIGIASIICFSFLLLLGDYFVYFPFAQGAYSYSGFKDLYQYLRKIESNYDNIVIAPTSLGLDQLYIYYLFYNQYNPQLYQKGQDINRVISKEGWVYVEKIGKWYFVNNLDKVKFPLTSKTLFITDGSFKEDKMQFPTDLKPQLLHTIYYLNGNVAFKVIKFD